MKAAAGKVLGIDVAGDTVSAQFSSADAEVATLGRALAAIGDPATELALLRMSANVANVGQYVGHAFNKRPWKKGI